MQTLHAKLESWPIRGSFAISRGSKRTAEVITVTISDDGFSGQGECVPYAHYGESTASVLAQIKALDPTLTREQLDSACPPGAARNAIDCALWDLQAKQTGIPVWQLAGLAQPEPCQTAYTLSLDTPDAMAHAAAKARNFPLLKLKLGSENILRTVTAVRRAAPDSKLILDANEAWDADILRDRAPRLAELGVALIEQPLPADRDAELQGMPRPVPLCADESCHGPDSLAHITGRYDLINLKLDKTGGLTAALTLARAAREAGLGIMVGCMVGTSLSMAPALLLAGLADYIDLDGPLLLERDRPDGLRYGASGIVHPPAPGFWG